ncbi:MAG: Rid family hydrolase [Thermoanaerobaculales bacterium]|nr:Rid family hydrolase [Thermoanaerobaculales bacterium]
MYSGPGDLSFITSSADRDGSDGDEGVCRAYEEIGQRLEASNLVILHERIFGDVSTASSVAAIRTAALGEDSKNAAIPPTHIEGRPCTGNGVAGIHVIAARPSTIDSVETIDWRGAPCGRHIVGDDAMYLALSDPARLVPAEARARPADEAREALFLAEELLREHDWSFADVRRTWFYLDDILSWYDDFNRARNDAFRSFGLLNGSPRSVIPASTGIRGRNARGHRCTFDLLATRPLPGRELSIKRLHNPLQNEAPEYGSSFSRGLSVATNRCRYFLVSGTASIDEEGNTVHAGDFEAQAKRTIDNVESLLASGGAVFDDICQASAFIKFPEDVEEMRRILRQRGLEDLPLVCTIEDICRDDLLVELDATAVIARPSGR